MFDRIICWFSGHEPGSLDSDVYSLKIDLEGLDNVSYITFCKRCGRVLTWSDDVNGWIPW